MTREDLARCILLAIADAWDACKAAPKPRIWSWRLRDWQAANDQGPVYRAGMFGDLAADEASRRRVLRMVRQLESDGLLELTPQPNAERVSRVRLTAKGRTAVKELKSGAAC